MDATARIEDSLAHLLNAAGGTPCPPRLAGAMRHAVFPGGARIRPRLCLSVASACGEDDPRVTAAAACAIELLHCASLVHDDLPCFDDAPIRRGRPSVHRAFGEPLAVLAGDALIVLAFQAVADGAKHRPLRLAALVETVGAAVAAPCGIVAGQAWESEPYIGIADYHKAKTGALFAAATMAGAAAAGQATEPWRALGERLGQAFQIADDIRDVASSPEELGKPAGQDAAHGRINAARELGLVGAVRHLESLIAGAVADVPPCPGATELRAAIVMVTRQFLPKDVALAAA
jgi:geranylgeranyl diphosphate synthase type II